MKSEFKPIEDLYGISKSETLFLEKKYGTVDNLKRAIYAGEDVELIEKDIERLKKYFDSISEKDGLCISCRHKLPNILDRGICPYCGVRNLNGNF